MTTTNPTTGNRDKCGRCHARHNGNTHLCPVHGPVSFGCCDVPCEPAPPTAAHTPGPWRVESKNHGTTQYIVNAKGSAIARISGTGSADMLAAEPLLAPREANAALIAQAPTLAAENARLRAILQAIVEEAEDFDDHDGRVAHISYPTLLTVRAALAREI